MALSMEMLDEKEIWGRDAFLKEQKAFFSDNCYKTIKL